MAEGGHRGALALAAGGRQLRDPGEIRAHRDDGQLGDLAVVVRGELQEVTAVGAQGVTGGAGVGQVGEEVVQVPGERMLAAEPAGDDRIHAALLQVAG